MNTAPTTPSDTPETNAVILSSSDESLTTAFARLAKFAHALERQRDQWHRDYDRAAADRDAMEIERDTATDFCIGLIGNPPDKIKAIFDQRNALRAFAQEIMKAQEQSCGVSYRDLQDIGAKHGLMDNDSPTPLLTGEKV